MAATEAVAAEYPLAPGQQAVGEIARYTTKAGDILPELARRFDVGYTALVSANPGVDPWAPGVGRTITIPSLYILPKAPHQGIVINLAQWRLFYFPPGGDRVETFPLGLGIIGRKTPVGATRIVYKEANPSWVPPPSIRAERPELPAMIPPGPDNPLGAFALHLGWPLYRIHGTNKPDGVGRNVSHGCIRLYPEDIARLFNEIAIGTPVHVVNDAATAGWVGNALYLADYPSKDQTEQIDIERPPPRELDQGAEPVVRAAAGPNIGQVDWAAVRTAATQRTGMPVRINGGAGSPPVAERDSVPLPYPQEATRFYDRRAAPPYDDAPQYSGDDPPARDYAPRRSYGRALLQYDRMMQQSIQRRPD